MLLNLFPQVDPLADWELDQWRRLEVLNERSRTTGVLLGVGILGMHFSGGRVIVQGFSVCSAVSGALIYEDNIYHIGFPCRKLSPGALASGRFKNPKAAGDFLAICMYFD